MFYKSALELLLIPLNPYHLKKKKHNRCTLLDNRKSNKDTHSHLHIMSAFKLKPWHKNIIHKLEHCLRKFDQLWKFLKKRKNTGSQMRICNTGEQINRLHLLMVPVVAEVGVLDAAVRHAVLSGQ
jgi:hypothetical protein